MKKKLKIWIDGKRIRGTVRCDDYELHYLDESRVAYQLFREIVVKTDVPSLVETKNVQCGYISGKNITIIEKQ